MNELIIFTIIINYQTNIVFLIVKLYVQIFDQ